MIFEYSAVDAIRIQSTVVVSDVNCWFNDCDANFEAT